MNDHLWLSFILWAFCAGWTLGWWLNRKPPVIESPIFKDAQIIANLVISPELLKQVDQKIIMVWLDQHGLTWMPKGAAFDPHGEIKK
jgi:hypothetical protein